MKRRECECDACERGFFASAFAVGRRTLARLLQRRLVHFEPMVFGPSNHSACHSSAGRHSIDVGVAFVWSLLGQFDLLYDTLLSCCPLMLIASEYFLPSAAKYEPTASVELRAADFVLWIGLFEIGATSRFGQLPKTFIVRHSTVWTFLFLSCALYILIQSFLFAVTFLQIIKWRRSSVFLLRLSWALLTCSCVWQIALLCVGQRSSVCVW